MSFLKKIIDFHDKFFAVRNFIFIIVSSSVLDLGCIKRIMQCRHCVLQNFLADEFRSVSSEISRGKGHSYVVIQETDGHLGQF